ncbi:MAG: sigma-70 family RNA polymerase sigma factor [Candidatus Aminicenantes bacterium]|jgi:RNA polymerase sigma-70 factor (ECF subfamily)
MKMNSRDKLRNDEFEDLLEKFSKFIKIHIQKFTPQKKGIDPDDILQEVKIKIWAILNDEKKIDNYASYIKKIVDSSVIDHLRRIRREEHILFSEIQRKIAERKSLYNKTKTYDKNLKEILGQAVDSLIESRRKVVKLYLLNMTLEEIADFFNWSRHKTRNLLYRGLNDLKNNLKEKGIEYED